jgi:hypothetical protein
MEFTCLPATQFHGGEILYIDDCDGTGAQQYFQSAFDLLGLGGRVDRYDVRSPSSAVGNSPASRVVDMFQQILPRYRIIIWNSGDLESSTIGDGDQVEKSNDYGFLLAFLDYLEGFGGVCLSGDNIGSEWASLAAADAISLRGRFLNFRVRVSDHKSISLPVSPYVIGTTGGCFDNIVGPDTLIAFGGCPLMNQYDVLEAEGLAVVQAVYDNFSGNTGAIIGQESLNFMGYTVRTLLSGFSYHQIRDHRVASVPARVNHLEKILSWFNKLTQAVGIDTPGHNFYLAQNVPNPFNPTTTIRFQLSESSPVSLIIYNVAGQLVNTLMNAHANPNVEYSVVWDGRDANGEPVASGVYFYKLKTNTVSETRKMVMLK